MPAKIVFTVVRNEAPFLLEWVSFYRALGFDAIVIYSNNSTDLSDALLACLSRHGVVEHHQHDPGTLSPQGQAAAMFLRSRRTKMGDWVLFVDADEFLNIKGGDHRIDHLIGLADGAQGVLLPWRMFGDAGHQRFQRRLISSRYTCAAPIGHPKSLLVKSLTRVTPDLRFIGVHTPQLVPGFWSSGRVFLTPRMTPVDPSLAPYVRWVELGGTPICNASDVSYDHVQLNHYFTRAPAAFELKFRRGSGGFGADLAEAGRVCYDRQNYSSQNFNSDEDSSILGMQPATDAMQADLLNLPGVADIQTAIDADYAAFETAFLAETSPSRGEAAPPRTGLARWWRRRLRN